MPKLKKKATTPKSGNSVPTTPTTAPSGESKTVPLLGKDQIFSLAREYSDLSAQIKALEERKKFLSAQIKDGCEKFGVKDDKGSFQMEDDRFILGKVCKKSVSLDQDAAVKALESLGLGDVVDVVTVKTVNEDRLEAAVANGRITLNKVEGFSKISVSYAVSVKEKETVSAEVTQTTLAAARKK